MVRPDSTVLENGPTDYQRIEVDRRESDKRYSSVPLGGCLTVWGVKGRLDQKYRLVSGTRRTERCWRDGSRGRRGGRVKEDEVVGGTTWYPYGCTRKSRKRG